jgi:hypothetical protein
MWEVEGHLTDTKPFDIDSPERGHMAPGDPIHDMWVRLAVDDELTIREIEVVSDATPYSLCKNVAPNFQRLVGMSLRPGFFPKIKEMLGNVDGCTHLVELIGPVATTAYQTLSGRAAQARTLPTGEVPPELAARRQRRMKALLNSCHSYAEDGEVVKKYFPELYTGTPAE